MKKLFLIIAMVTVLLSACTADEVRTDKPVVYTSFYAMYDFARTIGGDDIEIKNVVPVGADVHSFELSASDMAKLSEADLFIYNGSGIEHWAEDVVDTIGDSVKTVCTSDGIALRGNDPHIWLGIENAKQQLYTVYAALVEIDSKNSDLYTARYNEYMSKLDDLKTDYENAHLEGKKIFVTHGAYGYLCEEFGMEQIALEGVSGESDPSPAQMAKVVDAIRAEGAACIFYDPVEGDKMAQAVAREANVEALPLYTFAGDSENRDYLTVMKFNLEQFKKVG